MIFRLLPLTCCPDLECGAPAEEVNRFVLTSTDGPVTHVITVCVRGHRYTHTEN